MGAFPYSGREILWGLAPTRKPTSNASKNVQRANFVERREGEVRRTSLPRNWVNKGKEKDRGCSTPRPSLGGSLRFQRDPLAGGGHPTHRAGCKTHPASL
jgi:hypothetical protein